MYTYYTTNNKVICVSSFAGKHVRGIAKCSPNDDFSLEKGKELARLRCDLKIAHKRVANADRLYTEAMNKLNVATNRAVKMQSYVADATGDLSAAEIALENYMNTLN